MLRIRFTSRQDTQERTRSNDALLTWHVLNRIDNDLTTLASYTAQSSIFLSVQHLCVYNDFDDFLVSNFSVAYNDFRKIYYFKSCHCLYCHDPRRTPFVSGPLPHSQPQQLSHRYPPSVSPHLRPQNQTHLVINPMLSLGYLKPCPSHSHPRQMQAVNPSVNVLFPRSPSLVCLDPRQERSANKTCPMWCDASRDP